MELKMMKTCQNICHCRRCGSSGAECVTQKADGGWQTATELIALKMGA